MNNRIRSMNVEVRRLTEVEAEIVVALEPVTLAPTTELRGKLVGPRCPEVTTVEVAYPFRPVRTQAAQAGTLTARIVIPEPNLWTPENPFAYDGTVELW